MKAVLFDLGNVLIPYDHRQTLASVAHLCNGDLEVLHRLFHEAGRAFGMGHMTPPEFCDLVRTHTGALQLTDEAIAAAACAGLRRDEAALAFAVALQARPGLHVGVISNTNAMHVAWLDEHIPELRLLELVIFSNEVALLKPDPAVYALALELLEVEPSQAIFVDDLAENVAAAEAMGLVGLVHVDWGTTRPALEAWLGR
jgi:glucose-1-phosphatase